VAEWGSIEFNNVRDQLEAEAKGKLEETKSPQLIHKLWITGFRHGPSLDN